jgi:hypothetical protein
VVTLFGRGSLHIETAALMLISIFWKNIQLDEPHLLYTEKYPIIDQKQKECEKFNEINEFYN